MYRRWQRLRDNVSFIGFTVIGFLGFLFYCASISKFIVLQFNLELGFRNIIPYIRKYGKNPVTGASLKQEDLIPLIFHKNSEGWYSFKT